MGFEGEVPPEVMAEYKKMKGEENMEPNIEVVGSKEAERETDVGSLQAGLMSPEDFIKSVLAREGGDPARAEQAAESIKKFWVAQLDAGKITPEEFGEGVYNSAIKMLKRREGPTEKEKAREAAHKATLERVTGKRAA